MPKKYEVKVSNKGSGYPPVMHKKKESSYPSSAAIEKAGHEVKTNPPAVLSHTAKKFGKKKERKQKVAIMLAKARKGK